MPSLKYQEVVERVKEKPVFGVGDLTDQGVPPDYAKTLLYRLNQRGEVKRVEKGKYTTRENPLIVAPYLTQPSYLSLWTALRFHNMTQQSPFGVEVVTTRSRYNRKPTFEETDIQFHTVQPKLMFGYAYQVYDNDRIPVASPEKAIIDGLYLSRIPQEELKEVVEELNEDKLRHYAARAGQGTVKEIEEVLSSC